MTSDSVQPSLPFSVEHAPQLGPLERRVMNILWRSGQPHTARTVLEIMDAEEEATPAYTTVATVLGHLFDKGMLARTLIGRVWTYEATLTGCQFSAAHMVRSLTETNNKENCLARFVGLLDGADRALLAALLDDARD